LKIALGTLWLPLSDKWGLGLHLGEVVEEAVEEREMVVKGTTSSYPFTTACPHPSS